MIFSFSSFPQFFSFRARWRVQSSDTRCGAGNYTRHQFPAEASSCTESRWFQLLQAPPVRRRRAADGVQGAQGGDQLPHGGPQQGVVWRQGRDHPAVHQIGLQLHDGQGQTGWPRRQSKPWSRFGHCICFWGIWHWSQDKDMSSAKPTGCHPGLQLRSARCQRACVSPGKRTRFGPRSGLPRPQCLGHHVLPPAGWPGVGRDHTIALMGVRPTPLGG